MSGAISVTVLSSLQFDVIGTFDGGSASATIKAAFQLTAASVPLAAASDFPLVWSGSLTSTSSQLNIADVNLFDGVPALTLGANSSNQATPPPFAAPALALIGDFNLNLGGSTFAHPATVAATVRGAFLPAAFGAPQLTTVRAAISSGAPGLYVQRTAECSLIDCPTRISKSLHDFASLATTGHCANLTTLDMRASLTIDAVLSADTIFINSAAAVSQALYACGAMGYVGISLLARNSWQPWPLQEFLNDTSTAAYLTKAQRPTLSGYVWGALNVSNVTRTFVRSPLFGSLGGGRLVRDSALTAAQVTAFDAAISASTHTGVAALDAYLDNSILPDAATVYSGYQSTDVTPTWSGFLQAYAATSGAIRVAFGAECNASCSVAPTLTVAATLPSTPVANNDPLVPLLDAHLQGLISQINARFGVGASVPSLGTAPQFDCSVRGYYVYQAGVSGNASAFFQNVTKSYVIFATLDAAFSSGALSSVRVTWAVNESVPVIVAQVSGTYSATVGGVVSLDHSGNLVVDFTLANAATAFVDSVNGIAMPQLGALPYFRPLSPLSLDPRYLGDTDYMTMFRAVITAMRTTTTLASQDAAAQLADVAVHAVQNAPVYLVRANMLEAGLMELQFDYWALQTVEISASDLGAIVQQSANMAAMRCTASDFTIHLALPADSFVSLRVSIVTDVGVPAVVQYRAPLPSPPAGGRLRLSGLERWQVEPGAVLYDVSRLLNIPATLEASLLSAAPFPLPAVSTYGSDLSAELAWLMGGAGYELPLVASEQVCIGVAMQTGGTVASVTINTHVFADCAIAYPSVFSYIDDFVADLNDGLAACGMALFVRAASVAASQSGCYTLQLHGTTPGLIYRFNIASSLWTGTWLPVPRPEATTWSDLTAALALALPHASVSVASYGVAAASAFGPLIDASLWAVYQQMPTVHITLSLRRSDAVPYSSTSKPLFDASVAAIEVPTLSGNASLSVELAADLVFLFDTPTPSLCVTSNFNVSGAPNATVPSGPNNTITVSVEAFLRTPSGVTVVTVERVMTLAEGAQLHGALTDALSAFVLGVGWAEQSLSVRIQPGDALLLTEDQVALCLDPTAVASDTWIFPLSLSVTASTLPYVSVQFFRAPNEVALALPSIAVDASLHAGMTVANGTLGIFTIGAAGARLDSHVAAIVAPKSFIPWPIGRIATDVLQAAAYLSTFDVTVTKDITVSVQGAFLTGIISTIPPSDITLRVNGSRLLAAITDQLNWPVSLTFSNPALGSASNLSLPSVCDCVNQVTSLSSAVATLPPMVRDLPFMQLASRFVWNSRVNGLVRNISSAMCASPSGLTLQLMCDLLADEIGTNVCDLLTIDAATFAITLQVTPDRELFPAGFKVDLGSQVAFGMSTEVLLAVDSSVSVTLIAKLGGPDALSFRVGSGSRLALSGVLTVSGDVSTRLGPARVQLAGVTGSMRLAVTAEIGGAQGADQATVIASGLFEQPAVVTVSGDASMEAALTLRSQPYCSFRLSVPSLRAYLLADPTAISTITTCPGGLGPALEKILKDLPEFAFWSDIELVMHSFTTRMQQIVRDALLPRLAGVSFPLVERLGEYLLEPVLSAFDSAQISRFSTAWAAVLADFQKAGDWDRDTLEAAIMQRIPEAICEAWAHSLASCPAVITQGEYTLPLVIDKRIPLSQGSWSLGGHGAASLDWTCALYLDFRSTFVFTITYSSTAGLDVRFDADTILDVHAAINTGPCALQGTLLALGFSLSPNVLFDVAMKVNKAWEVDLRLQAKLTGTADLGLAGPIGAAIIKDSSNPDVVSALPHLRAALTIAWDWTLDAPVTTPAVFAFDDVTMCLGTYVARIAQNFGAQTIAKILDPLEPVFGPQGLLLQRIEIASWIGGNVNLLGILQALAKLFCAFEGCNVDDLFKAVRIFQSAYNTLHSMNELAKAAVNEDGCGFVQRAQSFNLDFTQPELTPEWFGSAPSLDFEFRSPAAADKADLYRSTFTTLTQTTGEFSFGLDITTDPIGKVIQILLGRRVPIAHLTIPALSFNIGAKSWPIIVWPVPMIYIQFGINVAFRLDIGQVALLSDGVRDTVLTGNPGAFMRALAVPTRRPDGSPQVPFSARLEIFGQVSVDALLLRATGRIGLALEASFSLTSINQDGYISFAEFAQLVRYNGGNPLAAFNRRLQMSAFLQFFIEVCVPIPFTSICRKIVDVRGDWPIFTIEDRPNIPPPIANSVGTIQLRSVSGGSGGLDGRTIELYPNLASGERVVSYSPSLASPDAPYSPLSRSTPRTPITFDATGAGASFVLYLRGVTEAVAAPPITTTVRVDSAKYGPTVHYISSTGISPAVRLAGCASLVYDELPVFASVSVSGVPCNTAIAAANSDMTFGGASSNYAGVITVSGSVGNVDFAIAETEVVAGSFELSAGAAHVVVQGGDVRKIDVRGHPTANTRYVLKATVASTVMTVNGGKGSDAFEFNLSQQSGVVFLRGNEVGTDTNTLAATIDLSAGSDVTLGSFLLVQSDPVTSASHVVHYSDIPRRQVRMNAAAGQRATVSYTGLEENSFVTAHAVGAADATIVHEVLSCNNQAELRLYCDGPGTHLVLIGDGSQTFTNFGLCTVRIFASFQPDQRTVVYLRQGLETEPTLHTIDKNTYTVREKLSTTIFTLNFVAVDLLVLQAGQNSGVNFISGTVGTETILQFPSTPSDTAVVLNSISNAVLINGSVGAVTVGPEASSTYSVDPFGGVYAPIAINAQPNGGATTEVRLVSGQAQPSLASPSQRFLLDANCLNPLDDTLAIVATQVGLSADMLAAFAENNFAAALDLTHCRVAYRGDLKFVISTGSSPDFFNGTAAAAPVALQLGANDDVCVWAASGAGSTLDADLGVGRDRLVVLAPLGAPAAASLGSERQVDVVDVFYTPLPVPNVRSDATSGLSTIGPLGTGGETLTLRQYSPPLDFTHLRAGRSAEWQSLPQIRSVGSTVYINASAAGEVLRVDLQTDTTYVVMECGRETTLVLDPVGVDLSSPSALTFAVVIQLPYLTSPCFISVPSAADLESSLTLLAPPSSGATFLATVTEDTAFSGYVTTRFGGLQLQSAQVDHLAFDFPSKVNLTLQGTADADVVVTAPNGSWVLAGDAGFTDGNLLLLGPSVAVPAFATQTSSLIIASAPDVCAVSAPASMPTTFDSGSITVAPAAHTATPWFLAQLTAAGLSTSLLQTQANVICQSPLSAVLSATAVTASRVSSGVQVGGLLSVVQGDLTLNEDALLTAGTVTGYGAVFATPTTNFTVTISPLRRATVNAAFAANASLLVACQPLASASGGLPNWLFAGTHASAVSWTMPTCAGTLQGQAALPALSFDMADSSLRLNVSLLPDATPIAVRASVQAKRSTIGLWLQQLDTVGHAVAIGITSVDGTAQLHLQNQDGDATLATDYGVGNLSVFTAPLSQRKRDSPASQLLVAGAVESASRFAWSSSGALSATGGLVTVQGEGAFSAHTALPDLSTVVQVDATLISYTTAICSGHPSCNGSLSLAGSVEATDFRLTASGPLDMVVLDLDLSSSDALALLLNFSLPSAALTFDGTVSNATLGLSHLDAAAPVSVSGVLSAMGARLIAVGSAAATSADLAVSGERDTDLQVRLAPTGASFSVNSSADALVMVADTHTFCHIQALGNFRPQVSIELVDGSHTIGLVAAPRIVPTLSLHGTAAATLTGDEASAIQYLGSDLQFMWRQKLIRPAPNAASSPCLRPALACTVEAWSRTATQEASCARLDCNAEASLVLNTTFDTLCPSAALANAADAWQVTLHPAAGVSVPLVYQSRVWWAARVFVFLGWLLPSVAWAGPAMLDISALAPTMLVATIAAFLPEDVWTRSLALAVRRGVADSFYASCSHPRTELYVVVPFAVAVGLLVLRVWNRDIPGTRTRKELPFDQDVVLAPLEMLERAVAAVFVFYSLPIMIAHVPDVYDLGTTKFVLWVFALCASCVLVGWHFWHYLSHRIENSSSKESQSAAIVSLLGASIVATYAAFALGMHVTNVRLIYAIDFVSVLVVLSPWILKIVYLRINFDPREEEKKKLYPYRRVVLSLILPALAATFGLIALSIAKFKSNSLTAFVFAILWLVVSVLVFLLQVLVPRKYPGNEHLVAVGRERVLRILKTVYHTEEVQREKEELVRRLLPEGHDKAKGKGRVEDTPSVRAMSPPPGDAADQPGSSFEKL